MRLAAVPNLSHPPLRDSVQTTGGEGKGLGNRDPNSLWHAECHESKSGGHEKFGEPFRTWPKKLRLQRISLVPPRHYSALGTVQHPLSTAPSPSKAATHPDTLPSPCGSGAAPCVSLQLWPWPDFLAFKCFPIFPLLYIEI